MKFNWQNSSHFPRNANKKKCPNFLCGVYMLGFISWLSKSLVTVCTLVWYILVWFISCLVQRKSWAKYSHMVWFLFRVNPNFMTGFIIWRRETLVTVCTLVWFLICVNPFMPGLVIWPCESLLTSAHWYGFSFVWILSWLVLSPDLAKVFSQYMHIGMVSLSCESFHDWSSDWLERNSSHNMHIGMVSLSCESFHVWSYHQI